MSFLQSVKCDCPGCREIREVTAVRNWWIVLASGVFVGGPWDADKSQAVEARHYCSPSCLSKACQQWAEANKGEPDFRVVDGTVAETTPTNGVGKLAEFP